MVYWGKISPGANSDNKLLSTKTLKSGQIVTKSDFKMTYTAIEIWDVVFSNTFCTQKNIVKHVFYCDLWIEVDIGGTYFSINMYTLFHTGNLIFIYHNGLEVYTFLH